MQAPSSSKESPLFPLYRTFQADAKGRYRKVCMSQLALAIIRITHAGVPRREVEINKKETILKISDSGGFICTRKARLDSRRKEAEGGKAE
jgi:hypothetical protein